MRSPFVAACVLAALTPPPCFAWNNIGHMAVAKAAYDQLSDGEKLRFSGMLRRHPHYEDYLAKHRPDDVSLNEWAFLRAATWPDWVRPRGRPGEADPRGEGVVRYHRRDDHFINVPFVHPADAERFAGKDLRPDADMNTVVCAYKQRVGELTLATTSEEDKAVALCWLLHLIGDIHQPLHAVSQYSSIFPDKRGDLGGNLFGVKVEGKAMNLHRFWDDLFGDDPNYTEDGPERQATIYRKAKEAAEGLRDPKYDRKALKADLTDHADFPSWVQESFEAAKAVAYKNGELKPARVQAGRVPPGAEEVGEEYIRTAKELARKRGALAGHRLADKLKTFLARKP